jgi:hypothetical protein
MKLIPKRPTTQLMILLPITLIFAYARIASLPEAPEGDTSFAWLPFFLAFGLFIALPVLLIVGGTNNKIIKFLFCLLIPIFLYAFSYWYVGAGTDGIPYTLSAGIYWFGSMIVATLPAFFSILPRKHSKKV